MTNSAVPSPPSIKKNNGVSYFEQFFRLEAAGGILLLFVLVFAMIIANVPGVSSVYQWFLDIPIEISIGQASLREELLLWVNEGLMAVFFLILALEIKREVLDGELASVSKVVLPGVAAIGGIVGPALIYLAINYIGGMDETRFWGWPISTTTDIAFTLGVIAMLGTRVPVACKAFVVALSIVDDILAVSIIAVFYTNDISLGFLVAGIVGILLLVFLNVVGVKRIAPYILIGIFIWICILEAHVHATLAGVAIGLTVPLKPDAKGFSALRHLEHILHPWVAFVILPVFVFCNGGITFNAESIRSAFEIWQVPVGIAAGLCLGKSLGVFASAWLAIKLGLATLPRGSTWGHLFAIGALTGIGFTMSLFLGSLAFTDSSAHEDAMRIGVIGGSILSAALGIGSMFFAGQALDVTEKPEKADLDSSPH
jgi:NhaA family Na+:H+ antiporter